MSQRRGGSGKDKVIVATAEEMMPFGESLDMPSDGLAMDRESLEPLKGLSSAPTSGNSPLTATNEVPSPSSDGTGRPSSGGAPSSVSLDGRFEMESQELKMKRWKEGPFATGFTEATWEAEYRNYTNNPKGECMKIVDNEEQMPCGCCSAMVCCALGAGRVGNIAVLRQSTEWVEEEVEDENGEMKMKRYTRPRLDCVVGPYWPMLLFITYPLIIGVSMVTLVTTIPKKHPLIGFVWLICTISLIACLALTAFRDPGILPRYERPPPNEESTWRWHDRAHSYRPRGAWYDPDTAVIVEHFDHTCMWAGTTIGKKNKRAFYRFLCFLYPMLILDSYWILSWWRSNSESARDDDTL